MAEKEGRAVMSLYDKPPVIMNGQIIMGNLVARTETCAVIFVKGKHLTFDTRARCDRSGGPAVLGVFSAQIF